MRRAHLVGGERRDKLAVEALDDSARRAGGRHDPVVQHRLEARHA
jgi:hypothetical protein